MNPLLQAQQSANHGPNPFGQATPVKGRARSARRSGRNFGDPVEKPNHQQTQSADALVKSAQKAQAQENPFKGINPDDPKLKQFSTKARVRVKKMSDSEFVAVINAANKVTYDQALQKIDDLDGSQPPSDKQLYEILAGAMRSRVSEQHLNDLFDRINKKWKSCSKAILKEMREAIQLCVDMDGLQQDNEPGKRTQKTCNISEEGFKDQTKFGIEGLRAENLKEPTSFRYGSGLARIVTIEEEDRSEIDILSEKGLRAALNTACNFEKNANGGGTQGCSVPQDVVSDIFQNPSLPLPYLRSLSTYPVFDEDLNLIVQNGYHSAAYMYLRLPNDLQIPKVSSRPSQKEVEKALRLLIEEYLADFPFDGYSRREILITCGLMPDGAGDEKKPVPPSLLSFLAYLLQPLVRPVIGKSPMPALLVTKPAAGSGATKLVDTAQMVICGQTSTRAAMPSNEEERRKNVFSALLGGAAFITFDNVTGSIDSSVLAALLTSVTFTDRVLGKSLERSIPNTASVAMTGNNPNFTRELLRRISLCRLDAGVAEPDKRTKFKHKDLEGWVAKNRGKLLWALCTLVMHWKSEDCPKPQGVPLASFAPWFNTCGGILETAGLIGFQSNRHELDHVAGGDEEDPIHELIKAWFEIASNPATKFKLTDQYVGGDYGLAALADSAELTLDGVRRKKVDLETKYDATSLGRLLAQHAGRVIDIGDGSEILLSVGEKTKHGKPWSLEVVKAQSKQHEPA